MSFFLIDPSALKWKRYVYFIIPFCVLSILTFFRINSRIIAIRTTVWRLNKRQHSGTISDGQQNSRTTCKIFM